MKEFYTQKEVAERFRCSKGTIIDWSKNGCFDIWRSPRNGRVLYTIESVERFYKKHLEVGRKKTNKYSRNVPEKTSTVFKVPTGIYLGRMKNG